jgi:DNA-binding transcriptional ArsR family regulator
MLDKNWPLPRRLRPKDDSNSGHRMLQATERPAGEIAAHFSLTRPAVSQHLTVLLESDLVSVRQEGTRRLYHANRDRIEKLRSELDAFWGGRMAKLKTAAERAQKRKKR